MATDTHKKTQTEAGRPRDGFSSNELPLEANCSGFSEPTQAKSCSSRDCPLFDSCNASVCPLDPAWERHRHLSGERVCRWLREAVKPGGHAVLEDALPTHCAEMAMRVAEIISIREGELGNKLRRAAKQGSKSQTIAPWQRGSNV